MNYVMDWAFIHASIDYKISKILYFGDFLPTYVLINLPANKLLSKSNQTDVVHALFKKMA